MSRCKSELKEREYKSFKGFPVNSVQRFYQGKTFFITGASGFMGKVLLEKLLYVCDVKEIFILMRPKRNKSGSQRVADFEKLPIFVRVMTEKPEMMKRITPVFGEISLPNLGLSDEDLSRVTKTTDIFIHLAATLRLEATLKPAIQMNLLGTKNALDVAKMMSNLLWFMHTSTAFCCPDIEVLEEKIHPYPEKPANMIRCAETMTEEEMAAMQKEAIGIHPNTYTFSKRLAETLVNDEYKNLPIVMVRPSIVTPALQEPLYGWVDSLNGIVGVSAAAGKGVLRCMMIDVENTVEAIPVDLACNGMLLIIKNLAMQAKRPLEMPVYNLTCHESKKYKYREMMKQTEEIALDNPLEWGLWYPSYTSTKNYYYFKICTFLFQWIPAFFIDVLSACFFQKRLMMKFQRRIAIGMDVLQFFSMHKWFFKQDKFHALNNHFENDDEIRMFFVDTSYDGDEYVYLRRCVLGGRQYCMKEPLSTLPKARIQLKILYIIDRFTKLMIVMLTIWGLLKVTGLYKYVENFFSAPKSGIERNFN